MKINDQDRETLTYASSLGGTANTIIAALSRAVLAVDARQTEMMSALGEDKDSVPPALAVDATTKETNARASRPIVSIAVRRAGLGEKGG